VPIFPVENDCKADREGRWSHIILSGSRSKLFLKEQGSDKLFDWGMVVGKNNCLSFL
jgi:hypothetical protein